MKVLGNRPKPTQPSQDLFRDRDPTSLIYVLVDVDAVPESLAVITLEAEAIEFSGKLGSGKLAQAILFVPARVLGEQFVPRHFSGIFPDAAFIKKVLHDVFVGSILVNGGFHCLGLIQSVHEPQATAKNG